MSPGVLLLVNIIPTCSRSLVTSWPICIVSSGSRALSAFSIPWGMGAARGMNWPTCSPRVCVLRVRVLRAWMKAP
eukprot:1381572-Alexandrium_andersonii.AAC.1